MADGSADLFIENKTFDELKVGDAASLSHTVAQRDIDLFASATGDVNPAHVDPAYASTDMFHHIIIHGMWGAGLISAALGTKLPGPGAIYLGQDLHFTHPIHIGDTVTAKVTVREKKPEKGDVVLDCLCTNQDGQTVISGTAFIRAPTEKVRVKRVHLPSVIISRHDGIHAILARACGGPAVTTAVAYPIDIDSLTGAVKAAEIGLIAPILIGPSRQIKQTAAAAGLDISAYRLVDAPDSRSSASLSVALVRSGEAMMLMKGDLHTETLMHAVVAAKEGLRTGRQISHVYLLDVPEYQRPLILTDVAINITPNLAEKAGIVQNAIDFAHVIGIAEPRVAILAAVETVNARLPSTLDAAALCKMADRGQIIGGRLDGPLAFDNAINPAAAKGKGIISEVAGRADILVAPNLEAGNMLAKQLIFLASAEAAGVVLGARVPIILTSRADSVTTRLASCALGVLLTRAGPPVTATVAA